jgi:peptide/nickel transport system substrate-binding protein
MKLRWIGLALTALLVAGGCASTPQDSGDGGDSAGSSGILRLGTNNYIDTLNPFIAIESQSYNAFIMQYPQLVQYGPGLEIEGDWAQSWENTPDGLKWTFHLEPGVKW